MAWGERGGSSASHCPSAPTKSSQANLKLKQVLLACLLCKCILKTGLPASLPMRLPSLSVSPEGGSLCHEGTGEPVKRETHTHRPGDERLPQAGRREAGGCLEPSPRFTGCGQPQVVTVLWNVIWLANFWIFCLLVFFNEGAVFWLESLLLWSEGSDGVAELCEPVVWAFQQKGVS